MLVSVCLYAFTATMRFAGDEPPLPRSLSPSPIYYFTAVALSCYPSPFCSLSHSSTLTGLKIGLSSPFRISGGIHFTSRCSEESPEWPRGTILWILILLRLFVFFFSFFFFFNLISEHDVSIDQIAVNRGKKVLIEFAPE